jgi:hypothetical protein
MVRIKDRYQLEDSASATIGRKGCLAVRIQSDTVCVQIHAQILNGSGFN